MNEQEFINGVHRKINILQHERSEMEILCEKQKTAPS